MDQVEGTPGAELELREQIAAQAREIEELKARLNSPATSRRNLLKGAGVVAGGLAAIGAAGATGLAAAASPAGAIGWEAPPNYGAAPSVAAFIKANGNSIAGENFDGRFEGGIEAVYFQYSLTTALNARSGLATGRRQHEPIIIRKRMDSASPLLAKALCNNEAIEGIFKFYRPDPSGEGTTQHYFTIEIKSGRVVTFHELSPDNQTESAGVAPSVLPLEQVSFSFQTILWRSETSGTAHEDAWGGKL